MKRIALAVSLLLATSSVAALSASEAHKLVTSAAAKQGISVGPNGEIVVRRSAAPFPNLGGKGELKPASDGDAGAFVQGEVARQWVLDAAPVVEIRP